MMSELNALSNVIALIYDSALDDEAWPAALNAIARFLDVKDLAIGTHDSSRNTHETLNLPIDPDFTRSYFEHWAERNFLWQASAPLPVGELFSFECAGPPERVYRSAIYNEWFRPQGLDMTLGANLIVEGARSTVITVYRPRSRPEFGAREVAQFRALLPNLQRAMRLRDEISAQAQGVANLRALIDVLDKPAALVDRDANILIANGFAETLFRDGELVATGGRLAAPRLRETSAMRALIHSAATGRSVGGGGRLVVPREGAHALVLLVAPLAGARFGRNDQLAIVFVNDPTRRPVDGVDLDLLRAQFGLTKSEAEVASALLRGLPLKAASRSGATVSTTRTHLARVFEKTGVHSQRELLNLLRNAGYGS